MLRFPHLKCSRRINRAVRLLPQPTWSIFVPEEDTVPWLSPSPGDSASTSPEAPSPWWPNLHLRGLPVPDVSSEWTPRPPGSGPPHSAWCLWCPVWWGGALLCPLVTKCSCARRTGRSGLCGPQLMDIWAVPPLAVESAGAVSIPGWVRSSWAHT